VKHHPPENAVHRARKLRKRMTEAERALWRILRESFPEQDFRKQVPIRHFIVDFVSHRSKLAIEVDGGQHETTTDLPRTKVIEGEGYRVLRFWNNEVLGNSDGVWTVIDSALRAPHPTPAPPHQGEG